MVTLFTVPRKTRLQSHAFQKAEDTHRIDCVARPGFAQRFPWVSGLSAAELRRLTNPSNPALTSRRVAGSGTAGPTPTAGPSRNQRSLPKSSGIPERIALPRG